MVHLWLEVASARVGARIGSGNYLLVVGFLVFLALIERLVTSH